MSNNSMMPQQYCLRWRYHHSNLQTMFSQLLEREAFCDVTLACDGRTIKAHKIVLSACSTYFDTILSQYEEKDPILIMKDVKFVDIKCLVEFMYKGEINVEHAHLATLLKTAEDLRIKGLAEVSWRDASSSTHNAASSTSGTTPTSSTSTPASSSHTSSHNGIQHALANVATVMGTSPKDGGGSVPMKHHQQQQLLQQQLTMNKRKRGRPPIDDYEQPSYTLAPKIVSVMSGSTAEESASNDDGTSASDHDNDGGDHQGIVGGHHHRNASGGGKASGSSQWDEDDVDRINSFGEHMLSGIRVKTELNTEDEYVDYDQAGAVRSRTTSTNASQLNNSISSSGGGAAGNNAPATPSFSITQLEKEWPDVIRLNDYLNTGRRQQFWEEPFTKRVMDAIKTKNLEMKSAAELLGVSYGTLYGRYRDAYGCLKHPYSLSRSGLLVKMPGSMTPNSANPGGTANWIRDAWSDQGSTDIIMKLKRKEITLFKAAEQLKMTPQALSNYLISFSMGMDPEMANTVAKLLAQQSADDASAGGGAAGQTTSQLQLQLQQGQMMQMPPLRRLNSCGVRMNNDEDGSILGDDDDEMEAEEDEEEEEDEEQEEVVTYNDHHHQQPRARQLIQQQQRQNDEDDDDEEDSILPDIPISTKGTNHHHSFIGNTSALANCPDITIIRKEKLDQLIGNSSRMNNNDHSEQRGNSGGSSVKIMATAASSGGGSSATGTTT